MQTVLLLIKEVSVGAAKVLNLFPCMTKQLRQAIHSRKIVVANLIGYSSSKTIIQNIEPPHY